MVNNNSVSADRKDHYPGYGITPILSSSFFGGFLYENENDKLEA